MQTVSCRLLLSSIALSVVLCGRSAFAQGLAEEDLSLAYGSSELVSIATGAKQPLRLAPAVATVITAKDISEMGATDLDQVMESVPGVHVTRSPVAYGSQYDFDGIHSTYNTEPLVLLNGVPMTTLQLGNKGNLWMGMPLDNVARVEVLRDLDRRFMAPMRSRA